MSMYQFLPAPDVSGKETEWCYWDNGFSDDEINQLINLGEGLRLSDAVVGEGEGRLDSDIRISKVSWLNYNHCGWLYDRMAFIARQLNGLYYNFDLFGFAEDMQYTVYESKDSGHYNWHIDKGFAPGAAPRKLSMVLQLTDPSEYEGGDFVVRTSKGEETLEKKKGRVYCFPSYLLHRVTPVTRGTRKTIVVWITGPKFK